MTKALMKISYSDPNKGIYLTNYADTVIYDEQRGIKTLCAIRFGGYPEQVEAMANAIYGGGSIQIERESVSLRFISLVKRYRKTVSHDGVYAEATLIAEDDVQQKQEPAGKSGKDSSSEELEPDIETDLPPRNSFIYVRPGDREALFDAVDEKTAVPLIPEFSDYLLAELEHRNILCPLKVIGALDRLEAWMLRCESGDSNIVSVVEDGLFGGNITIPGAGADSYAAMEDVDSVTKYLTRYGTAIAERIKNLFNPLFDPAKDTLSPEVLEINRYIEKTAGYSLYEAQLAVAESIKRQLEKHKIGLIIAECGAGKTKIGLTAIAAAIAGQRANQLQGKKAKTFNIVLCPSHITKKWVREIEETLPDTEAGIIGGISDFDRFYRKYEQGDKSCYAVISKETARDGYMHAPAVIWSARHKTFVCPDCGTVIEMPVSVDGSSYMVKSDQFFFKRQSSANHKCAHCGTPLWTMLNSNKEKHDWIKIGGYGFVYKRFALQHLDKAKNPVFEERIHEVVRGTIRMRGALRKYPLSTYIKKRYKGRIDALIVDELHQYNNESGQGDAMNDLFIAAKKAVGMTATLINGYSSGIFHLLYRIMPGMMKMDCKDYQRPNDFISEYGVLETTYEEIEQDYNSNRRTVKSKKQTRQRPGVSPLVYSRFLLEYAAFLSLSDMGKDLPEYEEIPVPVYLPKNIMSVYSNLEKSLREVLQDDRKAAQKILSTYLNLLTAYPDQPYSQPPVIHPISGITIVEPPDLGDIDTVMMKDEKGLEIIKRKIAAGDKVLIYTNWTRLDSQQKFLKLLTAEGYRTEILPAKVQPIKREEWVADRLAGGLQILIVNPSLVETGLDLNAFTTLIFYDTGYKLFTLRQASRRSWRINQTASRVEVYMLYYANTMQHKAMRLMATKLAVAGIIEGGFSEEGLAAMSQCEDMTTLMAKELMLGIKDNVEDVSAAFKRMAILKPVAQPIGSDIFCEEPVVVDEKAAAKYELIEFCFVPAVSTSKVIAISDAPKAKDRKNSEAEAAEQMSLFDFIA